jgi:hypothetical protein|tara:strand:+ start:1516 stop:2235 length:720 start_codon:yes stop_codon:yes gene_type:complete
MIKNILTMVIIITLVLFVFGWLMDQAMADVTGAEATTNTQTNSSGTNTAITGGMHTETDSTTNYQSGSSSNTTTTNTTNSTNNSFTGDTRVVPSANAAAIGNMNQMVCTSSVSGGIQKFGLGVSVASHQRDLTCELVLLAKTLHLMGMKVASLALLCTDERIFLSMAHASTHCPYMGLIGSQAEEHYQKYPKLRPDYETYTKDLRYIDSVDKKIEQEENKDETTNVISHSGGVVKLGNQ